MFQLNPLWAKTLNSRLILDQNLQLFSIVHLNIAASALVINKTLVLNAFKRRKDYFVRKITDTSG